MFSTQTEARWSLADAKAHRKATEARAKKLKPIVSPLVSLTLVPIVKLSRLMGKEYPLYRTLLRPMYEDMNSHLKHALDDYQPKAGDVLTCVYFKCGTNWTMQMAHQIAHLGEGEYDYIYDVIAWPDGPDPKISIPLDDETPYQSATGLRIIKSHAKANHVPFNKEAKYIVVIRDPKDAFVSGYHFSGPLIFGQMMPSVEAWLDIFLSEHAIQGIWHEFLASWWPLREQPNVLFMRYEQIKDDPDAAIRKIATLMGVELTQEVFDKIKERSSFAYMKSIDHKFYPPIISPLVQRGGTLMRKGQTGSAGELLSKAQQKRIDDYCSNALKELGCDFPYDELYRGG